MWFHGSTVRQCRCSPLQIENYLGKISGPLLDRIAIHVAVRPVDIDAWKSPSASSMTSAAMREMVARAREIQTRRFADTNGVDCNARIPEGMFAHSARWSRRRRPVRAGAEVVAGFRSGARAHRPRRANTRTSKGASASLSDTSRRPWGIVGGETHIRVRVQQETWGEVKAPYRD